MLLLVLSALLNTAAHATSFSTITASWYHLPGNTFSGGGTYVDGDTSFAAGTNCMFDKKYRLTDPSTQTSIVVHVRDRFKVYKECRPRLDLPKAAAEVFGFIGKGKKVLLIEEVRNED